MPEPVLEQLTQYGVVPVIAIESVESALPLADALLDAGLPVIEITFRTSAAADVIQCLAEERPQMLVGAGTVLTHDNLESARQCGAKFALAPGLNPEIVLAAQELDLPFMPGVATASDIECALSLDCRVLKFFPSEALGGLGMIKALSGPYAHTGVRFVPTGGVNRDNLADYLRTPIVAAIGGTWLAKKDDLEAGRWNEIRQRAAEAVEIARQARGT